MDDLTAALQKEARLKGPMFPTIMQLIVDQQAWIRKNLKDGHVPGRMKDCPGCDVCRNAEAGYALLRRFEKTGLAEHVSTLQP